MESSIAEFLKGYGPFAVLFFFLLVFILKEHKDDKQRSLHREEKLMEHISKSDDTQKEISENVRELSKNVFCIQQNMTLMQKDIDILKDKIE